MTKVPDFYLEKYAAGSLSDAEKREIEQRMAADDTAQGRLEQIRRSNLDLMKRLPPDKFTEEVKRRDGLKLVRAEVTPQKKINWPLYLATPLAAAALLLIAINVIPWSTVDTPAGPAGPDPADDTALVDDSGTPVPNWRRKGGTAVLTVYKKTAGKPLQLETGDFVSEGDVLQMSYISTGARYGLIYSVDGRGSVSLHFPINKTASQELKLKKETALGFSYALDDAPESEVFYFITSDEVIDVKKYLVPSKPVESQGIKIQTIILKKRLE